MFTLSLQEISHRISTDPLSLSGTSHGDPRIESLQAWPMGSPAWDQPTGTTFLETEYSFR